MRRLLPALVLLGVLAILLAGFHPIPAYADDTLVGIPASLATAPVAGADSLLPISSAPAHWWGGWGWGGWPWWAGMPLWQISALTGFTWPWSSGWWWPWYSGWWWPWWGWGWPWWL